MEEDLSYIPYIQLTKYFPAFVQSDDEGANYLVLSASNVAKSLYKYPDNVVALLSLFARPEHAIPTITHLIEAFVADESRPKQTARRFKKRRIADVPPAPYEDVVRFLLLLCKVLKSLFLPNQYDAVVSLSSLHDVGGYRTGLRCHYNLPFMHPKMHFVKRQSPQFISNFYNKTLYNIPGCWEDDRNGMRRMKMEKEYIQSVCQLCDGANKLNHLVYYCPVCGGMFQQEHNVDSGNPPALIACQSFQLNDEGGVVWSTSTSEDVYNTLRDNSTLGYKCGGVAVLMHYNPSTNCLVGGTAYSPREMYNAQHEMYPLKTEKEILINYKFLREGITVPPNKVPSCPLFAEEAIPSQRLTEDNQIVLEQLLLRYRYICSGLDGTDANDLDNLEGLYFVFKVGGLVSGGLLMPNLVVSFNSSVDYFQTSQEVTKLCAPLTPANLDFVTNQHVELTYSDIEKEYELTQMLLNYVFAVSDVQNTEDPTLGLFYQRPSSQGTDNIPDHTVHYAPVGSINGAGIPLPAPVQLQTTSGFNEHMIIGSPNTIHANFVNPKKVDLENYRKSIMDPKKDPKITQRWLDLMSPDMNEMDKVDSDDVTQYRVKDTSLHPVRI
tara:strand:+ start:649 stop:2469 length:1821 start_codon:yes stop_codon:yes gene_type:complete